MNRAKSTGGAAYSTIVYDSIREVDWDEWNRLRDPKSDPFMDPRFVLAVENSMGPDGRFWHVIIRDEQGLPAAAACLCSYPVDGALLAEGGARKIAAIANRVAPPLLKMRVLLCGLPISCGVSHLRFAPTADRAAALRMIEGIVRDLARRDRANCIVFREFEPEECEDLALLQTLGYRRADSLPMNCVPTGYGSFDDYVTRTNAARRRTIRRSQEKFVSFGLKVVHLTGGDGVADRYTDEVHALYEAVWNRAAVRFERLPATFFRELARQMPDKSQFTFVYHHDRVVAFAASIFSDEVFDQMFVGIDDQMNRQCDLYFNLFFRTVGSAFEREARRICVGQTSDEFKHQKLSTFQVPRSIYVKGVDRRTRLLLRCGFRWFFPPRPLKYPDPRSKVP